MTQVRLLLVESNSEARATFAPFLESLGFQVEALSDGLSALDAFYRQVPSLMVLNHQLDGLPGPQVCEIFKAHATVPVIMYGTTSELAGFGPDELESLGVRTFLTLPFDTEALVEAVESMVYTLPELVTTQPKEQPAPSIDLSEGMKALDQPSPPTATKPSNLPPPHKKRMDTQELLIADLFPIHNALTSLRPGAAPPLIAPPSAVPASLTPPPQVWVDEAPPKVRTPLPEAPPHPVSSFAIDLEARAQAEKALRVAEEARTLALEALRHLAAAPNATSPTDAPSADAPTADAPTADAPTDTSGTPGFLLPPDSARLDAHDLSLDHSELGPDAHDLSLDHSDLSLNLSLDHSDLSLDLSLDHSDLSLDHDDASPDKALAIAPAPSERSGRDVHALTPAPPSIDAEPNAHLATHARTGPARLRPCADKGQRAPRGIYGTIGLTELLLRCERETFTGRLMLQRGDEVRSILLVQGDIAISTVDVPERVMDRLAEAGHLDGAQRYAVEVAHTQDEISIGRALLNHAGVQKKHLVNALKEDLRAWLRPAFGWTDGLYGLLYDRDAHALEHVIHLSPQVVVFDGVRHALPAVDLIEHFQHHGRRPCEISPKLGDLFSMLRPFSEELRLVEICDGQRSVGELIALSGYDLLETLRILRALEAIGGVTFGPPKSPDPAFFNIGPQDTGAFRFSLPGEDGARRTRRSGPPRRRRAPTSSAPRAARHSAGPIPVRPVTGSQPIVRPVTGSQPIVRPVTGSQPIIPRSTSPRPIASSTIEPLNRAPEALSEPHALADPTPPRMSAAPPAAPAAPAKPRVSSAPAKPRVSSAPAHSTPPPVASTAPAAVTSLPPLPVHPAPSLDPMARIDAWLRQLVRRRYSALVGTHYQVIGVRADAEVDEIRETSARLLRALDPKSVARMGDDELSNKAEAVRLRLLEAAAVLREPTLRAEYDAIHLSAGSDDILEAERCLEHGQALLRDGDAAGALTVLDEACDLDRHHAPYRMYRGWARFLAAEVNDFSARSAGFKELKAAVREQPTCDQGFVLLGNMHRLVGREEMARRLYKKALEINNDNVLATRALAQLQATAPAEE